MSMSLLVRTRADRNGRVKRKPHCGKRIREHLQIVSGRLQVLCQKTRQSIISVLVAPQILKDLLLQRTRQSVVANIRCELGFVDKETRLSAEHGSATFFPRTHHVTQLP